MEWRKKIIIIFSPLLLLTFFLVRSEKETKIIPIKARKVASTPHIKKTVKKRPSVIPEKKTRFFRNRSHTNNLLRNRIPQSVESTFEKDKTIKMTRGYEFLKDVAAIPKERFTPSMGSVIQRSDQFIYFRANPGHQYIPVAISRTTNVLYPISSILHIKGATPEIRSRLLAEGYVQYYYHPPLKLLSLESKSGEVLNLYTELEQKGYQVELEVLKPPHQTI